MHSTAFSGAINPAKVAQLSALQLTELVHSQAHTITTLGEQVTTLTHQLEWFKRQVFGNKRERFAPEPDPTQLHLGEVLPIPSTLPELRKPVPAHSERYSWSSAVVAAARMGRVSEF